MKIFSSPLTNIKITDYFKYKHRFNGVFLRNNLSRMKDFTMIKIGKERAGTEYIPQEVLKKWEINKLLTTYLEYKIMNLLCVEFIELLP